MDNLTPDEINARVDKFNDDARELEARLEELGRSICSIPSSGSSWSAVNRAIDELRSAIHNSYMMYQR